MVKPVMQNSEIINPIEGTLYIIIGDGTMQEVRRLVPQFLLSLYRNVFLLHTNMS